MNTRRTIENYLPIIGLVAGALLLLTTAFATGAMSQEREALPVTLDGAIISHVDEQSPVTGVVETSPLSEVTEPSAAFEIKLRALNPSTCGQSSLWLVAEITNVGRVPVRIVRDEMWAAFSYRLLLAESDDKVRGVTFYSGTSLDYFELKGGESYRDTFELSLKGKKFFKHAGKFTLTTRIESVKSNEVTFELSDCGNTKEEAK